MDPRQPSRPPAGVKVDVGHHVTPSHGAIETVERLHRVEQIGVRDRICCGDQRHNLFLSDHRTSPVSTSRPRRPRVSLSYSLTTTTSAE